MDWSEERYVRLYVRDSVTWKLLPWQSRCVLVLLLRKVDRVGVLDFGPEGYLVAAQLMTDLPMEVVEAGIPHLITRNIIRARDNVLLFPKFLEAQEARYTDKTRAKEYRARQRDQLHREWILEQQSVTKPITTVTKQDTGHPDLTEGAHNKTNGSVTPRDAPKNGGVGTGGPHASRAVTPASRAVTPASQNERNRHSVQYSTVLSDLSLKADAEDLTGSAREEPPPEAAAAKGDKPPRLKIRCPKDLWNQIPEDAKAALDVAMIPRHAQLQSTMGFVAKYGYRDDDVRFLDAWISGTITKIQGDWNMGRHRTGARDRPSTDASFPKPMPQGTPLSEQHAGPLSQLMFNNGPDELDEP